MESPVPREQSLTDPEAGVIVGQLLGKKGKKP